MRKPKAPVRRAVKAVAHGDACSPPCAVCLIVRGRNAKKETAPKPVQNDLAKFNDLMDENRRLRGEVRRYRRVLRVIVQQDTPPKNAVPEVCWECGEKITEGENIDGVILCCYGCVAAQHGTMRFIAEAALAPRRRKK